MKYFKKYDFDEKFITRESICRHFYPGGWGWGAMRGLLFESMLSFWKAFFQKFPCFAGFFQCFAVPVSGTPFSFWNHVRTIRSPESVLGVVSQDGFLG